MTPHITIFISALCKDGGLPLTNRVDQHPLCSLRGGQSLTVSYKA